LLRMLGCEVISVDLGSVHDPLVVFPFVDFRVGDYISTREAFDRKITLFDGL